MTMQVIKPAEVKEPVFTRSSTALYLDSTSILQTAAVNTRRPTFNAGPRNLLIYSEQFDNVVWSKNALTLTANNTTAPDGTVTADRVFETATTGAHYIQRVPLRCKGQTYTYSVFVKPIGSRTVVLQAETPIGTYRNAAFDITSGTVINSSSIIASTVVPAANGFFRCSITFSATEGNVNIFIVTADLSGNQSLVGSTSAGLYVWGAQLESGPTVTTYIPTVADTVALAGSQSGWIYEPSAATNILTNSRADTSVATGGTWVLGANTTRIGSTTAPDGTNTATIYQSNAVGNSFASRAGITLNSSTTYTASIWAKIVSGSPTVGGVLLFDYHNGTGIVRATLSLSGSGIDNTWRRFSITVNNVTGTSSSVIYLAADFTAATQIAVWGAQIEVGSSESSFIPTTTATVTRAAEVYTSTGHDLISTTAVELYLDWNPGTNYTVNTKVIRQVTGRTYQNLIAGVDATLPENAPTRWVDIGPSNRMAMFDKSVSSVTTAASPLTVVLQPGQINSIAFQQLTAQGIQITMKDFPGGTVVYDHYIDLEFAQVTDFYEWFMLPYEARTDAYLMDLPEYPTCELTVTITGDSSTVMVGLMTVGSAYELGQTQYGAQIGILNYSRKTTDSFGNTTITPRGYARRMDVKLWAYNSDLNRTYRLLSDLKDIPCMWIAVSEEEGYEALSVYGFYKDFTIDVSYPTVNYCNLQIEGLT